MEGRDLEKRIIESLEQHSEETRESARLRQIELGIIKEGEGWLNVPKELAYWRKKYNISTSSIIKAVEATRLGETITTKSILKEFLGEDDYQKLSEQERKSYADLLIEQDLYKIDAEKEKLGLKKRLLKMMEWGKYERIDN